MADPETETTAAPPAPATPSAADIEQRLRQEFSQQFGGLKNELNTVVQYVASQAAAPATAQGNPPPTPAGATAESYDDQLFKRAAAGDKDAFVEWTDRRADARIQQTLAYQNANDLVDGQLRALMQKYPVLTDASHPLTQTANLAYKLMTQRGYQPGKATLLDAAKTAIADRPDLVADLMPQTARERTRRSAVNSGMTGASHREDAPSGGSQRQPRLSEPEWRLAQRMGFSDPKRAVEAKARFMKRQEDGTSRLGAVAGYVTDEGF